MYFIIIVSAFFLIDMATWQGNYPAITENEFKHCASTWFRCATSRVKRAENKEQHVEEIFDV